MGHVKERLNEYRDGELGGRRKQSIEAHLIECEECRAELERLERLSSVLSRYRAPSALSSPERFRSQVLLRLPRPKPRWERQVNPVWFLVPASLLCAVLAIQVAWGSIGFLGAVADIASEGGVDVAGLSAMFPATVSGLLGAVQSVSTWPLMDVTKASVFFGGYLLVLSLSVLYAGWVGVLMRSAQRVSIRKGE